MLRESGTVRATELVQSVTYVLVAWFPASPFTEFPSLLTRLVLSVLSTYKSKGVYDACRRKIVAGEISRAV